MVSELVKKILAAKLPDLEFVEPSPGLTDAYRQSFASKPSPSLAELRAKYLGYAADSLTKPAVTAPEHVEVHQARARGGNAGALGNRTLIFSEKGLMGAQG